MNEDILAGSELSEESVEVSGESVETGSGDSADAVVTDSDNGGDGSSVSDGSTGTDISVVFPDTYYNAELGGYPVVIVNDVSGGTAAIADYTDYYTTMADTWAEYYSGVLANMGDTDYIAYCLRDYASSAYSSYTDHYVLYYGLEVENGSLVSGTYPYMDIYRESSSSGYVCATGTAELSAVPFPSYGSFGNLSDIRKGVTHGETYALLFAVGFAAVYSVCTRIFGYVLKLRGCGKG